MGEAAGGGRRLAETRDAWGHYHDQGQRWKTQDTALLRTGGRPPRPALLAPRAAPHSAPEGTQDREGAALEEERQVEPAAGSKQGPLGSPRREQEQHGPEATRQSPWW